MTGHCLRMAASSGVISACGLSLCEQIAQRKVIFLAQYSARK